MHCQAVLFYLVDEVYIQQKENNLNCYFKVFEVAGEEGGSFSPRVNLEPPHYDGIQSLAIRGHELFSGSRDTIIKKWDLDKQELITVSTVWFSNIIFSQLQMVW